MKHPKTRLKQRKKTANYAKNTKPGKKFHSVENRKVNEKNRKKIRTNIKKATSKNARKKEKQHEKHEKH